MLIFRTKFNSKDYAWKWTETYVFLIVPSKDTSYNAAMQGHPRPKTAAQHNGQKKRDLEAVISFLLCAVMLWFVQSCLATVITKNLLCELCECRRIECVCNTVDLISAGRWPLELWIGNGLGSLMKKRVSTERLWSRLLRFIFHTPLCRPLGNLMLTYTRCCAQGRLQAAALTKLEHDWRGLWTCLVVCLWLCFWLCLWLCVCDCVSDCVCGCVFVVVCFWLCVCGCVFVVVCLWLCASGCVCGCVFVVVCLLSCL